MRGLCRTLGVYSPSSLLRNSGLNPGRVHVEFVVNKLVLEQVFLRVLLFSPVGTTPVVLHAYSFISFRHCMFSSIDSVVTQRT